MVRLSKEENVDDLSNDGDDKKANAMREKGEEPIRVSSDLSDQREGGSIGKGTSPFSTAPHLESSNLPHSEEVSSEHHSSAPSVLRKGLKEGHAIFTEQRSSTTGGEGCSRTAIQDPPAAIVNRRTEPVRLREQEGAGSSPGEGRSWSRVVRGTRRFRWKSFRATTEDIAVPRNDSLMLSRLL